MVFGTSGFEGPVVTQPLSVPSALAAGTEERGVSHFLVVIATGHQAGAAAVELLMSLLQLREG